MNLINGLIGYGSLKSINSEEKLLAIKEGSIYSGKIISNTEQGTLLDITTSIGRQEVVLNQKLLDDFKPADDVEIYVEEYNKKNLKLRIEKTNKNEQINKVTEIKQMHENEETQVRTNIDKDAIKNAIMRSDNPLQYSQKLDQHIDHAIAQIDEIARSFSDGMLQRMTEEGFDIGKMSVDLLYQVGHSGRVDKKIALEGENRELAITVNEEKISSLIDEMKGNSVFAQTDSELLEQIGEELINKGVDLSPQNVEKMIRFVDKVDKIKAMEPSDIIHFLSSNSKNTVKELYKSMYVSHNMPNKNKVSDMDYKEIEPEVVALLEEKLFEDKGLDETLRDEVYHLAKELVTKGIPMNDETIDVIEFVLNKKRGSDYLEAGAGKLEQGLNPDTMQVTSTSLTIPLLSGAEIGEVIETVSHVTPSDIEQVLRKNSMVNLLNLQKEINAIKDEITIPKDQGELDTEKIPEPIIDKEMGHLDVLRYQMTYKAVMRLNVLGYDIKGSSLENLQYQFEQTELRHVTAVTTQEASETRVNNSETLEPVNVTLDVVNQTYLDMKRHFAVIQGGSSEAISKVALREDDVTINKIALASSKGIDRYDELRTQPRSDLGDQVEKAFQNVDDILEDLNLEKSEYNRRSVEILGRNEMPITSENIEKVKQVDIQLQQIFDKMMPEHVKELMSQNVDILNEPIENLTEFLMDKESQIGIDIDEAIAKSLVAMDKSGTLSSETREALIGVYRMMHTIQGAKGTAIGFLVDQNMSVTFDNLFEASKYLGTSVNNRHEMNREISDEMGNLVSLQRDKLSIKDQIKLGYFEKSIETNEILNKLALGKLDSMSEMTQSNTYKGLSKLGEQVVNMMNAVHEILAKENKQNSHDSIDTLSKMSRSLLSEASGLSSTMTVDEMNQLNKMSQNSFNLKGLFDPIFQLPDEYKELKEITKDALQDYMNNPSKEGQIEFQEKMNTMNDMIKNQGIERVVNQQEQLEVVRNQMELSVTGISAEETKAMEATKEILANTNVQENLIDREDYYTIPIMVDGQMQQMNMYFHRENESREQEEKGMTIYLSFSTENIGITNARINLLDDVTKVSVYASEASTDYVNGFADELQGIFVDAGFDDVIIDYDTFEVPKAVGKTKANQGLPKMLKRYKDSYFEKTI